MARKIRGRNEGSIYQRSSGSWRAQISLNGKRISFSAKTKTECQKWSREKQFHLDQGYDHHGGKIILGTYLNKWLETCKVSLRPNTVYQYGLTIKNHITPYVGNIQLKDLRLDRIEQLYAELLTDGVGTRTVRLTHSVLHRALEKAVKYGLIVRNPSQGAALPRKQQPEMQVLDTSQATQFLIAAYGRRYEALYHLAIKTGMRQGEIFGLKWSDLKWNSGTLYVQRQIQRVKGQGWSFTEPKTKAGRRPIELGEGTLQVLRLHKKRQELQKAVIGDRWQEHDLIFTSSVGTPCDASNLRVDFLKLLEKAGLQRIRFHDLRHTAASIMLNNGIPIIVVSKILGHSKPSITLDIYGHLFHEMQSEAAMKMDKFITPILVELPQ